MEIKSLTNNVIQSQSAGEEVFDFGDIKKGFNTTVKIKFSGNKIKNFKASSTCRCSVPTPKILDENTIELTIQYVDSHIVKPFSKVIIVEMIENGAKKRIKVKIKGNIKNE